MMIKRILKAIVRNTVWGRDNRSSIPNRFLMIYTVILPVQYFLLGMYGILVINSPLSTIQYVFGPIYADIWSYGLAVAGFTSLFGIIAEYRTPWIEAVGSVFIVTLLLLFSVSLMIVAITLHEIARVPSFAIALILLSLSAWRILDISRELRPVRHVS